MARTGQAAKAIKKAADAKPKVSNKKILKDATANAAMLIGPGKFLKAGKIVKKGVDSLNKTKRIAKDKEIIARSPDLKQTPNMTIGQAKRMKQGTKQLAKTTKRVLMVQQLLASQMLLKLKWVLIKALAE